jgi:hypothetical protein
MTLDEFRCGADAWGGRLERWPKDLRASARILERQNGEARRILAEARLLDDHLALVADFAVAGYRAQNAASKVMARIAEANEAQTASWRQVLLGWLLPAGGCAVAAALGIALATILAQPPLNGQETIHISAILDGGTLAEDLVVQ